MAFRRLRTWAALIGASACVTGFGVQAGPLEDEKAAASNAAPLGATMPPKAAHNAESRIQMLLDSQPRTAGFEFHNQVGAQGARGGRDDDRDANRDAGAKPAAGQPALERRAADPPPAPPAAGLFGSAAVPALTQNSSRTPAAAQAAESPQIPGARPLNANDAPEWLRWLMPSQLIPYLMANGQRLVAYGLGAAVLLWLASLGLARMRR